MIHPKPLPLLILLLVSLPAEAAEKRIEAEEGSGIVPSDTPRDLGYEVPAPPVPSTQPIPVPDYGPIPDPKQGREPPPEILPRVRERFDVPADAQIHDYGVEMEPGR